MASLTGNKIKDTYQGLMKTTDNGVIDANLKNITDGAGNATPLSMANNYVQLQAPTVELIESTGGTNLIQIDATQTLFEGNVDFTNAAVTGLPSAGLVSGTGADSLKNADSLVTNAATAAGPGSIAVGDGATVSGAFNGIAIGCSASTVTNGTAVGPLAETIGNQATAIGIRACADDQAVAIGRQSVASGLSSIAIGDDNDATAGCAIAIGRTASATQANGIAIGNAAVSNYGIAIGTNVTTFTGGSTVSIGHNSDALGNESVALGPGGQATGTKSISIGGNSAASGGGAISIGRSANASATNSVALGCGVAAAKADTVTVKELETCVAGGGIYLTTPDGLAQPKLTVNNSSELLIGGNPIGAAGLENGTGADSIQSAASLTTLAANASQDCDIAIGNGAIIDGSIEACPGFNSNIAIGNGACVLLRGLGGSQHAGNIAIGQNSFATNDYDGGAVAIGRGACANAMHTVALGSSCALDEFSIAIGQTSRACNKNSVAIGRWSCVSGDYGIALGSNTCTSANNAVAIGFQSVSSAVGAIALGAQVTGAKADTVTVKELETCVAGGGVIMTTPDGTAQYKITIDNTGALVSTLVV